MEAKDNRKRAMAQIKIFTASKAALANYDIKRSAKVLRSKKESNSILPARKQHGKENRKHKDHQCYCMLRKKAGIHERKYKRHSSENCV